MHYTYHQYPDTFFHSRSPIRRPGGFKIPAAPSRFINTLDIYSQPAERRHLQQSMYELNSFIASEEEEDEDLEGLDVSDGEGRLPSSQSTPELDELEQAEAILRERRRARRLQRQLPKAKRRRKIVSLSDGEGSSSGDEGEELKAFRRAIHSELPSN